MSRALLCPLIAVVVAASALEAAAAPDPVDVWRQDQRIVYLNAGNAAPLIAQLRAQLRSAASDDTRCALGFAYGYEKVPQSAAYAVYLMASCNPDSGDSPPFAKAWSERIDIVLRQAKELLRTSPWSEMTLSSNAPGELIELPGWADYALRAPATIWLAPGRYQAVFKAAGPMQTIHRSFEVAPLSRGVIIVEHSIAKTATAAPSVTFDDDTPEAGQTAVVISDQHSNLVPERFLKPTAAASQPLVDPMDGRVVRPSSYHWSLLVAAGVGAHRDRESRARAGGHVTAGAMLSIQPWLGLEFRGGVTSIGGRTVADKSAYAWLVIVGPQFVIPLDSVQLLLSPSLQFEHRFGDRLGVTSTGATLSAAFGAMFGRTLRWGIALRPTIGLSELQQSRATSLSAEVFARLL
jgi:hypothetical protein